MLSDDFAKLKSEVDAALGGSMTKQDWARALGVSIASLHRYLDEKQPKEVPEELTRLMEAMKLVVEKSKSDTRLDAQSLVEAVKATGVAGVVARAASAGLLPAPMVSLLASTPPLIWLGALGGAVGAIVGASTLSFFQKIKPESTKPPEDKKP
jgi:hypothetical protein